MGILESARSGKAAAGKKDLLNHLAGKRLTQRQAIKAKCFDCNGMGESRECDIDTCSLLPYSPYLMKNRVARAKNKAVSSRRVGP
jgi:hypothetical protein